MNRRRFLMGVGGVALAAPLLSSLRVRKMLAQTPTDPKRLVIFFQPNGVNMNQFFPTVTNGDLTDASFVGRGVEALAPFRTRLLVPRGIHMSPRGFGFDGVAGCDHRKGMACKLTAMPTNDDGINYATGHSVDFEAARRINAGGADPLVLQVGRTSNPASGGATDFCSYSAPSTPYPGVNNPWNVYSTLANLLPGGEAEDRITRRRQSILDLVRDDLGSLRSLPMGMEDQRRIDDWLDLVRDTETMMMATCDANAPQTIGIPALDRYQGMSNNQVGSDTEYAAAGRIMMQLAALAVVCDMQRVVTIQWSRGSGGPTFRWDGIAHDYTHHQLSHRTGRDDGEGADIPGIENQITEVDRWYADRYVELLTLLDRFTESTGTVLDNSAVMWINELSDGKAHHFNNLPIIIAGSAGGYLLQGRAVDCSASGNLGGTSGAPHNKLLTTLLNAVGARTTAGGPIESFGSLIYGQPGEFDQLKA